MAVKRCPLCGLVHEPLCPGAAEPDTDPDRDVSPELMPTAIWGVTHPLGMLKAWHTEKPPG